MKPHEMKTGGVYNLTETTSGYSRTILVLQTSPTFIYVVLHYQYGDPWSKNIRSNPFIERDPDCAFRNETITLSQSMEDWHIQAVRKNSIRALIKAQVISLDTFQTINIEPGCLVRSSLGISLRLDIEGKSAFKPLKSAFVCWDSMTVAIEDLSRHGVRTF